MDSFTKILAKTAAVNFVAASAAIVGMTAGFAVGMVIIDEVAEHLMKDRPKSK